MPDDVTTRMREALRKRRAGGNHQPPPPPRRRAPAPPPPPPPRPAPRPTPAPRGGRPRTIVRRRSAAGLDVLTRTGHALGLAALLWTTLLATGWSGPLLWARRTAVHWAWPATVAVRERTVPQIQWLTDHVLRYGPGAHWPWLYPAVATAVAVLVRLTRMPPALQGPLGWTAGLLGLAVAVALGPPAFVLWPATALFLAAGAALMLPGRK